MLGNAAAAYAIALMLLALYAFTGLLGDVPLFVAAAALVLGVVLSFCVFGYLRGRSRGLYALTFNLLLAGVIALSWPIARDVAIVVRQTAAASLSDFTAQDLFLTILWIATASLLTWHAWQLVTWPVRKRFQRITHARRAGSLSE